MEIPSEITNTSESTNNSHIDFRLDTEILKAESKVNVDQTLSLHKQNQNVHSEQEMVQPRPEHFADGYPVGYWKEEQKQNENTKDEFIIYFNRMDERVFIHIYRMVNKQTFGYINLDLSDIDQVVNYLTKIYTWSHFQENKRLPNSYDLFKPSKTLRNVEMNTSPWPTENTSIVKLSKKTFNGAMLSLQMRVNQIPLVVQRLAEYHHTNKNFLERDSLNTFNEIDDNITCDFVTESSELISNSESEGSSSSDSESEGSSNSNSESEGFCKLSD